MPKPPIPDSDNGKVRSRKERTRVALVEGDVTIDCHIATKRRPSQSSLSYQPDEEVPYVTRPGGAWLLGELIKGVAAHGKTSHWVVVSRPVVDGHFPRLYTVWYPYKSQPDSAAGWRISKFLGSDTPKSLPAPEPLTSPKRPDLIVIDDKGRRFREERGWWTKTISQANSDTWFLIRTGLPLEDKGMWQQLRNQSAKVIAVTTAEDIRWSDVLVTRRLSWERATQDLYQEFLNGKNPALKQFQSCDFVIVSFTTSAVVVIENPQGGARPRANQRKLQRCCWLIYSPDSIEDEESRDAKNGTINGYAYCVLAAIANYLFQCLPNRPVAADLNKAIKNGLTASRSLYEKGFELLGDGISFPTARVVQEVTDDVTGTWGIVEVPARSAVGDWMLLKNQAGEDGGLDHLAKQIVKEGVTGLLQKLPFYRVGDLIVADRREIEGFRSVQRLLRDYARPKPGIAKPLSIAIFGPPGSGKSFGIEQLAKSEFEGTTFVPLTFNLSQLTTPDDLRGAFHQIRDKSLSGRMPLVFWDEFDSNLNREPLGWLRFFLSPMQDGRFRESQVEHFIGRAIFVFAGGTKETMKEFCDSLEDENGKTLEFARNAKAPDFVSRLRGYLDVLGPNPTPTKEEDPLFVVRRALILHSQLRGKINGSEQAQINIDEGVLHALLYVDKYKHGVRSIEAAIAMSPLGDRERFERSSLPMEAQLNLHVDGKELLSLLNSDF